MRENGNSNNPKFPLCIHICKQSILLALYNFKCYYIIVSVTQLFTVVHVENRAFNESVVITIIHQTNLRTFIFQIIKQNTHHICVQSLFNPNRFGYFFLILTGLYGYLIVFIRFSMINTSYIGVSRTRIAYILTFINKP
jgi:hypothetical protein